MGITKEIQELYESLSKNKIMKFILMGVAFVLLVFICIFVVRAILGQHVKIFGIEMSIPEIKTGK